MVNVILDIITKKRYGQVLTKEELAYIFNGYLQGEVPDYQMSAFLMAICIQDMSDQEIFDLVDIFIKSGEVIDLSFLPVPVVDKHSTGGVGDKTTLIIGAIVASCGVPIVKMSGRGLGYTGGTIDKLLSIPGFQVDLSSEEVKQQAKQVGLVITSQTASLTPLDKKVYALRDVSGTTSSVALIASSIMSKKIAGGAEKMVIDVKSGEGALLQDPKDVNRLCELIEKIGSYYHKEVRTVVSSMDHPLGQAVGNALEVLEAIRVLKNEEQGELLETCLTLATNMIAMGKSISNEEARQLALNSLQTGAAWQKFQEFVKAQHGNLEQLRIQAQKYYIKATKAGTIRAIHALAAAKVAYILGAGRKEKDDPIDPSAGIVFEKKIGDKIEPGMILATLYTNRPLPALDVEHLFEIA